MRAWKHRGLCWITSMMVGAGAIGPMARPAFGDVGQTYTTEQIDTAVSKAISYLYTKQHEDGRWENDPVRVGGSDDTNYDWNRMQGISWGGFTALCTYALLAAGEPTTDPRIQKAIKFLEHADIVGIYSLGLRAQVWTFLPSSPEIIAAAQRDSQLLLNAVNLQNHVGYYHYYDVPDGTYDRSVSQFGVLGVWACAQRFEVNPNYWQVIDTAWRSAQKSDGAWCYDDNQLDSKATMTAAGVATLFITQDQLLRGNECRGNLPDPNIEAGLKYLADNLTNDPNFYLWYGMERVGVASGRKYIGDKDWYRLGLSALMPCQNAGDGGFGGPWGDLASTSFFLLFTCRGRAPVCIAKAAYHHQNGKGASTPANTTDANWNQRPRDLANLSHWLSAETEQFFNWQTVTLDADVSELRDSPILMLDGNEALSLPDAEAAKLKAFIDEGGMVVGNPDCGSVSFNASFRKLGEKLYPYEFRQLPPTHPIYTHEQFPRKAGRPLAPMMGLSNGVRELMVLLPSDLSGKWALNATEMHPEAFTAAANLCGYSSDQQPQTRDRRRLEVLDSSVTAKGSISVARLQFSGNWDPEPYGWTRMGILMHNQFQLDVSAKPIRLGSGELTSSFAIADLTGTGPVKFSQTQRTELATFVKGGGTLIVDAAGGDAQFAESAENELKAIFPDQAEQLSDPLALDSPLYSRENAKIDAVEYRRYARQAIEGKLHAPRVRAMTIDKRLAVFYSAEDLSNGIVGETVDGVVGYTPETATEIVRNILLGVSGKTLATP